MAEKTEQPTSKKRKDSAKKGQTFKSKDVITTVILLMGIYFLAHAVSLAPLSHFIRIYCSIRPSQAWAYSCWS
jgi:type III secretion protein U